MSEPRSNFARWVEHITQTPRQGDSMTNKSDGTVEIIDAIANVIEADSTLRYSAGGEGIFAKVDTIDHNSATLIFMDNYGTPYEIRVRRVADEDIDVDKDGIIPPPVVPRRTESD